MASPRLAPNSQLVARMKTVKRMLAVVLLPLLAGVCPSQAAQRGERLWDFQVGNDFSRPHGVKSSAAISPDGTVYVGAWFYSCATEPGGGCIEVGSVYALNGATGEILWLAGSSAEVNSAPAIGANGTLYVLPLSAGVDIRGFVGGISALNRMSGEALWELRFDPDRNERWTLAAPAVGADGTVYFGGQGRPYALDGATGETRWEFRAGAKAASAPAIGTSSPAIGLDGTVYVGCWDAKVYALNGATGQKRWEYLTGGCVQSSPAIGADGTVYVGSNDDKVYAFDGATGQKRWEFLTGSPVYSSPAIGADGTVYVGSDDHKVYALEGATGQKLWEFQTAAETRSSPAIGADGTVYVGSNDGKVYALNGATGQKLWEFQTGGAVQSSPAIAADGIVYIGSDDGKFYALRGGSIGGLARSPWPKFRHDAQNTGRGGEPPPTLAARSGPAILKEGQESRFTVQVSGWPAPRLQWLFNGAALPAQTNATLVLPVVTRAQEGTYWLNASNALGQATSAPIVAAVSNVDPQRLVAIRWPGRADRSLSLQVADQVGIGAAWHTISNYPPAATEQRHGAQKRHGRHPEQYSDKPAILLHP